MKSIGTTWIMHPMLYSNPEKMAECQMIKDALFELGFDKVWKLGFGWDDAAQVHKEHIEKFKKLRLIPMAKRHGGYFPHMPKTEAIKEFIFRGFIHIDEADLDPKNIYIKCNIAPLVWPKTYFHHQNALAKAMKVGIPGYTGTVLPKPKK